MDAPARTGAGAPLDPQRLRYLTETLSATLPGLQLAVLGAYCLLPVMEDVYRPSDSIRNWLLLIAGAAFITMGIYIRTYYRRRFGWVESRNLSNMQLTVFLLALIALIALHFWARRPGSFLSDFTQDGSYLGEFTNRLVLPACWLVALCIHVIKRWQRAADPYRIYFLCFGTIICAAITLYPLWHPEAILSLFWRRLVGGLFPLSIIAWGLYNHFTLVRMMPKKVAEHDFAEGDND